LLIDTALSSGGQESIMRDYILGSSHGVLVQYPRVSQLAAWEQSVRAVCETLEDSIASDIEAASVTLSQGADGEVALLCGLVEELADEYGLDASFRLGHGSLTARFTRHQDATLSH
jgi:hypothetical protein